MPVNWNCHLFNKIVAGNPSGIFNLEGKFGFTDKVIVTFDDLNLTNYFGAELLNEFVPEGTSRELHYNKIKHLVEITPKPILDVSKIKNFFESFSTENLIRLSNIRKHSNLKNSLYLEQISSGELTRVNKRDYQYLRNNPDNSASFYLADLKTFSRSQGCAYISLEKEKVYGVIVVLSN